MVHEEMACLLKTTVKMPVIHKMFCWFCFRISVYSLQCVISRTMRFFFFNVGESFLILIMILIVEKPLICPWYLRSSLFDLI